MKPLRLLLVLICSLFQTANAQNLVLNPDFEEAAECPISSNFDFFYKGPGKYWTSPRTGTPDYYHATCGFAGSPTTTNNSIPHSGSAFAGFYAYGSFSGGSQTFYHREYVQGTLSKSLKTGHYYKVSFWIKPLMADAAGISAGISRIGMAFTSTLPVTGADLRIDEIPEIEYTGQPVTDTGGWTQISGCFRADGADLFFTIGNFRTDSETPMQPIPGAAKTSMAYILVDDVSVEEWGSAPLIALPEEPLCKGDTLELSAGAGWNDTLQYFWNGLPGDRIHEVTNGGMYVLQVTDGEFCSVADSVRIAETQCSTCHFYVPEAITPDENHWNDAFGLVSDCEPRLVRMQVYNRWGERIYDVATQNPQWDGKYNGEYVPQGVYIFILDVFYEEKGITLRKKINGAVTVIR